MNKHDLAKFAAFLAEQRDLAQSFFDEFGDRDDQGRARLARMALEQLWFATGGEHGQLLSEQLGGAA